MADQNIPVTANGNVQIDCDNDNNDTNRYIQFTHDNGTELMRIQENGYVGIGTSSPSNKVHIANAGGSTYIASDVFCTTDNLCTRIRLVKSNSNTLGTLTATGQYDLFGRIEGLGVNSTGSAVKIAASIEFAADGTPNSSYVPGEINFYTSDTSLGEQQRMTIKTDGKVGIGTTSPNQELEVNGTIRTTDLAGGGTQTIAVDDDGDIIIDPSDRRLKKEIKPIQKALDKVLKLHGVSFKWKSEAKMGKGRYYGMVAQEVKKVTPELVGGAPDGMLSVRYTDMVGLLVEAIKEQQSKMEAMEKRIKKLEAKKAK